MSVMVFLPDFRAALTRVAVTDALICALFVSAGLWDLFAAGFAWFRGFAFCVMILSFLVLI